MTDIATAAPTAEDLMRARCAHLKDLLVPWSIRGLAGRTGLTKATVESIYNLKRDISMSDIAVLAPVLRMTPTELFAELSEVEVDESQIAAGGGRLFLGVTPLHRGWSRVGPEGLEPPASSV